MRASSLLGHALAAGIAAGVLLGMLCACGSATSAEPGGGKPAASSSGTGGAGAASQGGTGGLVIDTGGSGGQAGSCVDAVVAADIELLPADIIFVIDNSASMTEETNAVEQNINGSFAQIIGASGVDYRVIMVTDHGSGGLELCIGPPLGTGNCNGAPDIVPGKFYHYSRNIQSWDSLCHVLDTFYGDEPDEFALAPKGWSEWLRPEAIKVFVALTDDRVNCTTKKTTPSYTFDDENKTGTSNPPTGGVKVALDFDKALLATSPLHFGSVAERRYLLYTINGLAPKNPADPLEPWGPLDPVTEQTCTPGAVNPGTGYQWIAKGTGGLRYQLCNYQGFDVVFNDIAAGVIKSTKMPCEIEIPEPKEGQTLDLKTVSLLYTPGDGGPVEELTQVDAAAACGPATDKFYVDEDAGKLALCPKTCEKVENDPMAKLQVRVECGGDIF